MKYEWSEMLDCHGFIIFKGKCIQKKKFFFQVTRITSYSVDDDRFLIPLCVVII